jgi:hypothetical protein
LNKVKEREIESFQVLLKDAKKEVDMLLTENIKIKKEYYELNEKY